MIITSAEKINVEIIPEILNMPMYCVQGSGYIRLDFFTELGVLKEDIKKILGTNNLNELNLLKLKIKKQDTVYLLPSTLASQIISQLALMSQYPIFVSIRNKLFIKSIETKTVTINELAEDLRQNSAFWEEKISNFKKETTTSETNYIKPHPQIDFTKIVRTDKEESKIEPSQNRAYISYKVTEFLCNQPTRHDVWENYLLKCLYFHKRELEYSYFRYHLLIKDDSVCLLTQTLLSDWMEETQFFLDIPQLYN